MSMIQNSPTITSTKPQTGPTGDGQRDLARLDRYLAIIENNRNSCRFVPDDAMLALDMAGYVRGHIAGRQSQSGVCAARLALALVQPCQNAPVQ